MNKAVVFNLQSLHDFSEYGIEIPLLNQRVLQTIEGLERDFQLEESYFLPASLKDLALAHDKELIKSLLEKPEDVVITAYELLSSDGSYNRYNPSVARKSLVELTKKARIHVAGTFLAAQRALSLGFSYHLGGGMHHAMSFGGRGFCLFNDIVIAARKLQIEKGVGRILVIDLDCHKGDGTAQITRGDDSIDTISIHMARGWPIDGKCFDESGTLNPSFIPSTLDIPVGVRDDYMLTLREHIDKHPFKRYEHAFVVHGADVYKNDLLPSSGGIQLELSEILERDLYIYNKLKDLKIGQTWCLGGGYGPEVYKVYLQFLRSLAF